MDNEIYKENILDHNRNPHNNERLGNFDISHNGKNVNCGDDITLYLKFNKNDEVVAVSWIGDGCAISTAATSMLTDKIKGLNKKEIQSLTEKDILDMLGVNIGISREDCAFLSLKTLKEALNNE